MSDLVTKVAERLKLSQEQTRKLRTTASVAGATSEKQMADREKKAPDGDAQEIGYAWSRQTVDTIRVVCLCLDELVTVRLQELRERAAYQPQRLA